MGLATDARQYGWLQELWLGFARASALGNGPKAAMSTSGDDAEQSITRLLAMIVRSPSLLFAEVSSPLFHWVRFW